MASSRNQRQFCRPSVTWGLLACAQLFACNALDEQQETPIGKTVRVIPTDERPVVEASSTPPVTGGAMLPLGENTSGEPALLLSDPARDRVSLVEGDSARHIEFDPGEQPFRLTLDASGAAYVVLRGSGQVAKLDLQSASVLSRVDVCATPRGIDYDALGDQLLVACAEGKLVGFAPDASTPQSELLLKPDLRDVVVQNERVYVSRFRSAEVLFIENGEVVRTVTPPNIEAHMQLSVNDCVGSCVTSMKPTVAWRMINDPQGGVLISHQRAVVDTVGIDPHAEDDEDDNESGPVEPPLQVSGSPYGGVSNSGADVPNCNAIVQSAVTRIGEDGSTQGSFNLAGVVLPVDLALNQDGTRIAVANAGVLDPEMPRQSLEFIADPSGDSASASGALDMGRTSRGGVLLINRSDLRVAGGPTQADGALGGACQFAQAMSAEPTTSVAFHSVGSSNVVGVNNEEHVAVLQRQTAVVQLLGTGSQQLNLTAVLGGPEVVDTGHEIFHRDSGGGLACASCHPEATDDGHVWSFAGIGQRRTQHLGIPLEGTAPFHWDGSLPNLDSLMDEVFTERMGGVFQSEDRLAALQNWMFARERPALPSGDEQAVARGKQLFHSAEVGCASCHSGSAFTDNKSYDVGTSSGLRLQVPPLTALLLRPPYMHDGCAETLHQRFDDSCGGGDAHGRTSQLSSAQIDDLVAYLKSL